jgi:hypothetical protein
MDYAAEPNPDDYPLGQFDPNFVRALARYEVAESYRENARRHSQEERRAVILADENAFRVDNPDYGEAVAAMLETKEVSNCPAIYRAIEVSESPAALAYFLAKNPAAAVQISRAEPLTAAMMLGRIEERLSGQKTTHAEGAGVSKASKAAPPPTHIKGAVGGNVRQFKTAVEAGRAGDFDKFCELREKEINKSRFG